MGGGRPGPRAGTLGQAVLTYSGDSRLTGSPTLPWPGRPPTLLSLLLPPHSRRCSKQMPNRNDESQQQDRRQRTPPDAPLLPFPAGAGRVAGPDAESRPTPPWITEWRIRERQRDPPSPRETQLPRPWKGAAALYKDRRSQDGAAAREQRPAAGGGSPEAGPGDRARDGRDPGGWD